MIQDFMNPRPYKTDNWKTMLRVKNEYVIIHWTMSNY